MSEIMRCQTQEVINVVNEVLGKGELGIIDSIYVTGSDAHGTKVPPDDGGVDDTDFVVIFMPSNHNLFGFNAFDHYTYNKDGLDIVCYSFPKLMKMMRAANPNTLALLFYTMDEYRPVYGPAMYELTDMRHIFLSKQLGDRFLGYAKSQIEGMKGDGAYLGYMGERRRELVSRHGYDTKAAAHALRLMWNGIDLFDKGEFSPRVRLGDQQTLISIKKGGYSLQAIQEWIESAQRALETSIANSSLPDTPDYAAMEVILVERMEGAVCDSVTRRINKSLYELEFGSISSEEMMPGLRDHLRVPRSKSSLNSITDSDHENSTDSGVGGKSPDMGVGNSTDMGGGENSTQVGVGENRTDLQGVEKIEGSKGGSVYDYEKILEKMGGSEIPMDIWVSMGGYEIAERRNPRTITGILGGSVAEGIRRMLELDEDEIEPTPGGYLETM